jgi:hypothetical protein
MAGSNCAASLPFSDARAYCLALSRPWLTRRSRWGSEPDRPTQSGTSRFTPDLCRERRSLNGTT